MIDVAVPQESGSSESPLLQLLSQQLLLQLLSLQRIQGLQDAGWQEAADQVQRRNHSSGICARVYVCGRGCEGASAEGDK